MIRLCSETVDYLYSAYTPLKVLYERRSRPKLDHIVENIISDISAKEKIDQVNPDVKVKIYHEEVLADNILDLIKDFDFIIDGTDNFPAKFLINDACVMAKKPFSHGGILRFDGQTMTYTPGNTCYRCVFSEPPPRNVIPSCAQAGVLGAIAGILGTIQATEALKFFVRKGDLLDGN